MEPRKFIRKNVDLKIVEDYLSQNEVIELFNSVKLNSDNNHKIEFIKNMKELINKLCFIINELVEYPNLSKNKYIDNVNYLFETVYELPQMKDMFSNLDIEFKRKKIKKKTLAKIELVNVDDIVSLYNDLLERFVIDFGTSSFLKLKIRKDVVKEKPKLNTDLIGETKYSLYLSKICKVENDEVSVSINLDVESIDRISEVTYFIRLNNNDGKILNSGKFEIENNSKLISIPVKFTSKDILKEDYVYLYVELSFIHYELHETETEEEMLNTSRYLIKLNDKVDVLKEKVERVFRVKVVK